MKCCCQKKLRREPQIFFWNASASERQFASKNLNFFDTSRVEEYCVFEWSISEYMGIVIHCWWYFVWEYFLKILGHIVWSLQTGTWHWRAFVVPISDLIHLRILQIFCLFVCLFGWIKPGQSNPWDASTPGEIVHTLLLEEYGVSKKWVIIKDKKQDSNTASTPSEASGPLAQDRYVARSSGGVSRKRGRNGEE